MKKVNELSLRERVRLNLVSAMEKANISQVQLADKLGISKGTVNNWVRGNNSPDMDIVPKICNVLDISIISLYSPTKIELLENAPYSQNATPSVSEDAMQLAQDYDSLDEHGRRVIRIVADEELNQIKKILTRNQSQPEMAEEFETNVNKFIRLRFSELKTSAGTGYQLDDDQTTTWKVLYNEFTRMADFCLEVDGQSMEPKICDGDIILIRQQPSVEIGEIGLFTVNDTGYVKKQGKDRLISINRAFPDVFPNEYDTVFCRGKVIGVLKPEWIVER